MVVTYVCDIPRSVYNKNQAREDLQVHPTCLSDSDNNYTIDEIWRREKIEYERNIRVEYDK